MEHQIQCQGKLLKRKREQDDGGPATKKVRGENQVGESKPENHVEEENDNPCSSTTAFEGPLKKIAMKPRNNQKQDMTRFLHGRIKSILNHLSKELVELVKPKPNGEDITTEAHFCSSCMRTVDQHELYNQLEEAKQAATQAMVLFQKEGSGRVLDEILHLDLSIAQYTAVKGSSYIPLPSKLKVKKAISRTTITNVSCGPSSRVYILLLNMWITSVSEFQDGLGIEFPVSIDKIRKFECQNNISVNVFGFEDVLFPLYITKEHCDTYVNILLYTQGTTRHCCLIKDLNK